MEMRNVELPLNQNPKSKMNDKSAAILGVVGTFLALTWIAVFLRLYVRAFILKRMQLADYFIIFTEVSTLILSGPDTITI